MANKKSSLMALFLSSALAIPALTAFSANEEKPVAKGKSAPGFPPRTILVEKQGKEILIEKAGTTNAVPPMQVPGDSDEAKFLSIIELIKKAYVDPKRAEDSEAMVDAALKGVLNSLDPHSEYMTAKEAKEFQKFMEGQKFGGIGVQMVPKDGKITLKPMEDTPAFRAGIKDGDVVTAVDGVDVQGKSSDEIRSKIAGEPGTTVKLTISRAGEAAPLEISIERAEIVQKSVHAQTIGKDIGYLSISTFGENTIDDFHKGIAKLNKELGDDAVGYIIDLRGNGGGLLDSVIHIADDFLEEGDIVSIQRRTADSRRTASADPGDVTGGMPLIVLINGGSASASEILAGALQDNGRAIIMGTQSFGKGSVQTVIPLADGSAIRLTIAMYFTPSGASIQNKGITPDIVVEPAKIEKIAGPEYEKEAGLKGTLDNPNGKDDDKTAKTANAPADPVAEALAKDYQLNSAVNLLRGMSLMIQKVFVEPAANQNAAPAPPPLLQRPPSP